MNAYKHFYARLFLLFFLRDIEVGEGRAQPRKGFLEQGTALTFAFEAQVAGVAAVAQDGEALPDVVGIDARALGRIGDPAAIPIVAQTCTYYEPCAHLAARDAYRAQAGEPWQAEANR